jgi:diguanylate cyclase (GGDEF)-like protein
VSQGDRAASDGALRALVEMTERALAEGLDAAVAGAEGELVALDPDARAAAEPLLAAALAAARRALAARDHAAAEHDELRALARVDDLTGALTRRAFFAELDDALHRVRRGEDAVTLVMCDLDGLKRINDAHGHLAGDAALRAFVDVVAGNLRAYDVVGRVGGDEFGLLLRGAEADATAAILCRLTTTIRSGLGIADVSASFGTARCPDDGTTRDELLAVADARLYEAKDAR